MAHSLIVNYNLYKEMDVFVSAHPPTHLTHYHRHWRRGRRGEGVGDEVLCSAALRIARVCDCDVFFAHSPSHARLHSDPHWWTPPS